MVDKISQNFSNVADEKFAAQVADSLDQSLDDIDELSLQRLKKARASALSSAKPRLKWATLSVAASLIVLVSVPFVTHQYFQHADQDFEVVSQDVPYSTEEMDDIDMLMSLEDLEDGDA